MGDYTDLFAVLDDYSDGIYYRGPPPKKSSRHFHPFARLPYEIRAQIWRAHCPALATQPLILQFEFLSHGLSALCGPSLAHQTRSLRAVLAAHHESRALALEILPDTLTFQAGGGVVRFKRERDIVLLHDLGVVNGGQPRWLSERMNRRARSDGDVAALIGSLEGLAVDDAGPVWRALPGFSENVVNLAYVVDRLDNLRAGQECKVKHASRFLLAFPNLRFVWSCFDKREGQSFLRYFQMISERESDAIIYALQLVDGALNPLGRAASSVFPGDPSPWRECLARAGMLKMLMQRAPQKGEGMDWEGFSAEELARLQSISVWPFVACEFEARRKARRKSEAQRRLSSSEDEV
ncbi:hypothetical protein IMZ48_14350 [Candidatus Bathyarchaeota archaeon]|nr:hypothetical protein [Candidatus Bathyarchaeota archaeon]